MPATDPMMEAEPSRLHNLRSVEAFWTKTSGSASLQISIAAFFKSPNIYLKYSVGGGLVAGTSCNTGKRGLYFTPDCVQAVHRELQQVVGQSLPLPPPHHREQVLAVTLLDISGPHAVKALYKDLARQNKELKQQSHLSNAQRALESAILWTLPYGMAPAAAAAAAAAAVAADGVQAACEAATAAAEGTAAEDDAPVGAASCAACSAAAVLHEPAGSSKVHAHSGASTPGLRVKVLQAAAAASAIAAGCGDMRQASPLAGSSGLSGLQPGALHVTANSASSGSGVPTTPAVTPAAWQAAGREGDGLGGVGAAEPATGADSTGMPASRDEAGAEDSALESEGCSEPPTPYAAAPGTEASGADVPSHVGAGPHSWPHHDHHHHHGHGHKRPLLTVFVSIDLEWWEQDSSKVTEIGWTLWDNWSRELVARHWVVSEYEGLRNRIYVPDHKDVFLFGTSGRGSLEQGAAVLQADIDGYGSVLLERMRAAGVALPAAPPAAPWDGPQPPQPPPHAVAATPTSQPQAMQLTGMPAAEDAADSSGGDSEEVATGGGGGSGSGAAWQLAIVGHGMVSDLKALKELMGVNLPANAMVLDTIALTWARLGGLGIERDKAQVSLRVLLKLLQIPANKLHNGGNDAFYTMQALLGLCGQPVGLRPEQLAAAAAAAGSGDA